MKALWSRTGLSHRCGCRACDQVVQAAGRPTAKNAAIRGRKPNYANRVAFYSSMLCTATIVDTVRKDKRAHDIDEEIKRVGDEVEQMRTRRQERLQQIEYARKHFLETETTPCDANEAQNHILWDHMERLYVTLPASKEIVWAPKLTSSNMIDDLRRKHYGVVDTASDRWSHARTQIDRILEEIKAEEVDSNVVQREPASRPQFERKRHMVLSMVTGLLGGAERLRLLRLLKVDHNIILEGGREYQATKRWLTDNVGAGWEVNPISQRASQSYRERLLRVKDAAVPQLLSRAEEVLDEAWQLLDNNDTNWDLDSWNSVNARQNTLDLNAHIRWLFQQDHMPFDEVIGHICKNIMLSPFLPDIHTFNLLMAEFAKRREHKLFVSVYKQYLDSRMMSTPATLSINALAQAMFTSHHGLRRTIASILGWDQRRGAKISSTEIMPLRSNDKREWLHAMSPVYLPFRDSLISTLLSFHLFESAAAMFLACVRAQVQIGWEVVQRIFEAHIEALDWQGSMLLIRGFCLLDHDFGYLLKTLSASEARTACQHLHSLLDIVGIHWTKKGKVTMSKKGLNARGLDSSGLETLRRTMVQFGVDVTIPRASETGTPEDVKLGSRVLQLESIDKELTRIRKTLYTIEAKMVYNRLPCSSGGDTLYHIGREAVKKNIALNKEFLQIQSNLVDPGSKNELIFDSTKNAIRADRTWLSKQNDDLFIRTSNRVWYRKTSERTSSAYYDKPGYFPNDGVRMSAKSRVVRRNRDTPINRQEGWRTLPKINWNPHAGSSVSALAARKTHDDAFAAEVAAHLAKGRHAATIAPGRPMAGLEKRKGQESDPVEAALAAQRRGFSEEVPQSQQAPQQVQPLEGPQFQARGKRFSTENRGKARKIKRESLAAHTVDSFEGNRFSAEAASG